MDTKFNRILYIAFLCLGMYQSVFQQNYLEAAGAFGIGLAFDPFDQTVTWKQRPLWQKVVLIINLSLAAAMLGLGIGIQDK